ncbi:MAG: SIS domain-containing protein [Proteobacteria bacterium]|nr:SIS domain-containing protein [Pseudomonadota bacterium]
MSDPRSGKPAFELGPDGPRRLRDHLLAGSGLLERVSRECETDILAAAGAVAQAIGSGNKLMLCGNGGSAADSQHIAAELASVLDPNFPRPALAALSLVTDTSLLTASANDFGFEGVFERQVQALGRTGDVLAAISTSGNSENVLRAAGCARESGIAVVGLTGESGGKLAALSDVCIRVPSAQTQHIQEAHIAIGHAICELVERALFPEGP